jgi:hypothetical protein
VASAARGARRVVEDADELATAPAGTLYANHYASTTYFWEFLGSISVEYTGDYSYLAATTTDSTSLGNPPSLFMVQARSGTRHWDSLPDSGYSVDNLPPAAPAPFTGQYNVSATHLHWNPNTEPDLANYRLYRGSSPAFATDAAHLVAAPPDTGYADAAGAPYYYKLTAVDSHGNESPAALLQPQGTLAVEPGVTRLALARPAPNPAGSATRIAFDLPRAGRVTLALFDASGRRVRTIVEGNREAGAYTLEVPARDDAEHALQAGLYFVRLTASGATLTQRLSIVP